MNALGIALLCCIFQVTLLSLLAAGAYALARHFGPRAGALVTLTSMVLIVGLTLLAFSPWPRWTLASASDTEAPAISTPSEIEATSFSVTADAERAPSRAEAEINADHGATLVDQPSRAHFWRAILQEVARASAPTSAADRPYWPTVLAGLVFVGAVLGIVRLVAGMAAVAHYRRLSTPVNHARASETLDLLLAELGCRRRPEMRESDAFFSAATVGWRRPVILLPNAWRTWSDQQLRAVLAHEIAHIQGNDFLAALLAQIGLALHFYHPVVHWLVARLRLEQELAADNIAAEVTGGRRPYLTTLAAMALDQEDRNVVWPARAFLPAKTAFLRRIVVLRNSHRPVRSASGSIRAVTVACMVLVGVFVAGLRPRSADQAVVAQVPDQAAEVTESDSTGTIDLSYVPEDAELVLALRPAAILERAKQIGLDEPVKMLLQSIGPPNSLLQELEPEEIEQLTVCAVWTNLGRENVIVRTVKAIQLSRLIPANAEEKSFREKTYFVSNRRAYFQLDDHTVAMCAPGDETLLQRILSSRSGSGPAFLSQEAWKSVVNDHGVIAYNHEALDTVATRIGQVTPLAPSTLQFFLTPPMDEVKNSLLGLRLDDHLGARAIISCKSEEGAAKVQETLETYKVLGRNMLVMKLSGMPNMAEALRVYLEFFDSVKIEQAGSTLNASGGVLIENDWAQRFVAQITAAQQAHRRVQSANNLKQLALAMHIYHDTYKTFPPAVLYGPDGETPYSWRVALLPFVDQQQLYNRYRFDEPWDGPNNRKLLEQMPQVFRHPDAPADSQDASYFVLTGPGTAFPGKETIGFKHIRDGVSNTLLFVEAKRDIPWTKPEDIPYDAEKPIPELGGFTEGGFQVAFCDGSVHFLSETLADKTLRALISIAGGERVNRSDY